ncbi:alpha/beta hydrolase [Paraglaciecola sp.]|uniref:alpha/beta hydrolase n=1 Tax=Paraglaciecola sp. TaxID=1920173 RepID=UPI003EF8A8F4
MKTRLFIMFACLLPLLAVKASEFKSYEMPRTQVVPIENTQTGEPYELYIKLPDKYVKDDSTTYPVIYFTDAVWHIDMLSGATEYLMENAILVGISWQKNIKNEKAHVSRFKDYSIKALKDPEKQAKYKFGQANVHLDFIRNDVIPYVEKTYNTQPDNRTYFGYSLGGQFGTYILMLKPDTFKNYILGSPSMSGRIPYLLELEKQAAKKHQNKNTNVFISYGSLENKLGKETEKLIAMLKNKQDKSLSITHRVLDGSHAGAFPLTGVHSITWLSKLQKQENTQ